MFQAADFPQAIVHARALGGILGDLKEN